MGLEISGLVRHPRIAGGVRLVEGVRSKLLPVGPYLRQHLRVMAVGLSARNKLRLHGINDVFFLLTHGLTQGIALATGEVGKLSRQEHHLLLIDGDAVGVLQIFLHAGDVIFNFLLAVLTRNKLRDIVHWSRTVEGVHGNEILEDRGVQLTQIFLHARRLKLERSHRPSLLIELERHLIIYRYGVEVKGEAMRYLDVLHRLLHDRER